MNVRQALSQGIRELRKWDLAPLGAVLVVIALAVLFVVLIALGRGPGREALIRSYFASSRGGGAPREQAKLIRVADCQPTGDFVEDNIVRVCTVTFRGKIYHPCFAWSEGKVVAGSRDLGDLTGCERVVWSPGVGTLVVA